MKRRSLGSSSISTVGYDTETSTLEIEFRNGGTYEFYAVPASIHLGLINAASAGAYFTAHIRPRYPARKTEHQ